MLHRLKAVASGYGSKPDWSAVRRTQVTLKLSSGSGGTWFLMYSIQTSSVTAAAFVRFHSASVGVIAAIPCRLKAWGFLIPYRGL
jgi:hypothetical protein